MQLFEWLSHKINNRNANAPWFFDSYLFIFFLSSLPFCLIGKRSVCSCICSLFSSLTPFFFFCWILCGCFYYATISWAIVWVVYVEARAIKQKMIEMELHCNGNMFVDYRQNEPENSNRETERERERSGMRHVTTLEKLHKYLCDLPQSSINWP